MGDLVSLEEYRARRDRRRRLEETFLSAKPQVTQDPISQQELDALFRTLVARDRHRDRPTHAYRDHEPLDGSH